MANYIGNLSEMLNNRKFDLVFHLVPNYLHCIYLLEAHIKINSGRSNNTAVIAVIQQ